MLQVWSGVARVTVAVPGDRRIEIYAVRRAGAPGALILLEAYDGGLVVGGELAVWALTQSLASLRAGSSQARRLAVRDDGRGDGGYLDLVCEGGAAVLYATGSDGTRRAEFATTSAALATDLATVLHHYLALTRAAAPPTVVLPDAIPDAVPHMRAVAQPASARAALIRPAPK
ncbi:MAG: hypothetical protein QOE45_2325 [Frankiaceae bacterium]|jgi:hypothetical protein|nr:hypothetical protein [Frankiaceae bacterium]